MIHNIKIKTKLLLSFSIVIVFFICTVCVGVLKINQINQQSDVVYQKNIRPLETLENFKKEYAELRRFATKNAVNGLTGDTALIESGIQNTERQFVLLQEAGQAHLNRLTEVNESQDRYNKVNDLIKEISLDYWPIIQGLNAAALIGDMDTMLSKVNDAGIAADAIANEMNTWFNDKVVQSANNTAHITDIAKNAMGILLVAAAFAIIVSISMALYIGNLFSRQIAAISHASREIADGNLLIRLPDSGKDEFGDLARDLSNVIDSLKSVTSGLRELANEFMQGNIHTQINSTGFHGVYREIAEEINGIFSKNIQETLGFMECITEFANGNFQANMKELPGEKIILNNTLDEVRSKLKSISYEINALAGSASQGLLDKRIDISGYQGDWALIMNTMNRLMEAVSAPIMESQEVLAQVAQGDFSHQVTGHYQGEFLLIQNSINNMLGNMDSYIGEISGILDAMAQNDLNRIIKREYVGKFSEIKDALNHIVRQFSHVVLEISSASDQVASGARQISESSMALAQGATEQASAVEELSATVQMINQNTAHNAENAKIAENLSEHSKTNAAKGDQDMKNMLASMDSIKESSNKISKIIKVIDNIAFQTNLLALNASVEAARAGSHGKGFAVVAEEVRSLAARCQEAAKDTALLIEESIERVGEGTQMAEATAQALQTIVGDVSRVADIITGIASSSQEQASAIQQVTEGLSLITEVVQNNSATSEESASASEELSSQAEMLQKLVDVFKLKKE